MKKRLTSLLLTAVFLLALVPCVSLNAGAQGAALDLSAAASDQYGNGWEWKQSSKTLTLFGVDVPSITLPAGANVRHTGYNRVSGYLYGSGALTVEGSGVLEASLISAHDGDTEGDTLTLDGGYLRCTGLSGYDIVVESGYIECSKDASFAAVQCVNGSYTQNGGYLRAENTGTGSAVGVNGMGLRMNGGYLEAVAACARSSGCAALWCSGNEVVNNGGVIKAVNTGGGYAIYDKYDSLVPAGGVTMASTTGSTAIGGKVYTLNSEEYWPTLTPDAGASGQSLNPGTLDGSEAVFAKSISFRELEGNSPTFVTVDGLYVYDGLYLSSLYNLACTYTITGGSYACSEDDFGTMIGPQSTITGTGTLVSEGRYGLTTLGTDDLSRMAGNLICIANAASALSAGSDRPMNLKQGDFIAVSHAAPDGSGDAVDALGGLTMKDASLVAVVDSDMDSRGVVDTARLSLTDSRFTAFGKNTTAVNTLGMRESEAATLKIQDSAFTAVSPASANAVSILYWPGPITANTSVTGSSLVSAYAGLHGVPEHILWADSGLRIYSAPALSGRFLDITAEKKKGSLLGPAFCIAPAGMLTSENTRLEGSVSKVELTCPYPADGNLKGAVPSVPQGAGYTIAESSLTAAGNGTYTLTATLKPADGYAFSGAPSAYLNGTSVSAQRNGDELVVTGTVSPASAPSDYVFPFTDVPESQWYYQWVKGAHQMGLINGKTETTYCPNDNMTYAEAIKLAACMHQKYTTGSVTLANGSPNWYDSYVTYCLSNGIISQNYDSVIKDKIDRQSYAAIFARALPAKALSAKNTIPDGSIPDVPNSNANYSAIYTLYRAGIVNGSDAKGSFNPTSNIKRSEVAAILMRMMDETVRVDAPADLGK